MDLYKTFFAFTVLIAWTYQAHAYQDHQHYSQVFESDRYFRVFTPDDYDSSNTAKQYPVIFYCNGCGGSYAGDQYSSYWGSGGYEPPYTSDDPVYNKPFNGDFEFYTDNNDVIIVTVDGKLYGTGGCDVYYPYVNSTNWSGNDFNYSLYFRELIQVVDSLYNTKADPDFRAVTGLSFGGHSAIWIAASNPHWIRSGSNFSHSPPYWKAGPPPVTTPIDVTQLWRNFRGISYRTSTNDQDYLFHYSRQLGNICEGAGFENEYHKAIFWRHWAADADSQFDFHMATFMNARPSNQCFSYINFYPDFDVWDYTITSNKSEEGWIYLRDVTENGMGVTTRLRLPFGTCLSAFNINIKTPPLYTPDGSYKLIRYHYRTGKFSTNPVKADSTGSLAIVSSGSMGEEIGITGNGLDPPVILLADTLNETIYIPSDRDTALSFDVVNLSETDLSSVIFYVSAWNNNIKVMSGLMVTDIPARSRKRLDSLAVVRAKYLIEHDVRYYTNVGYIKVAIYVNGKKQAREQFFQIHAMNEITQIDSADAKVFDGCLEWGLPVYSFTYGYGEWVSGKYIPAL
jgi:hypothetical protein